MIYKYFFWVDSGEVEIYKNGNLCKFNGEERYNYKKDIEEFWKKWEENSAFIPDDSQVEFIFAGTDKLEIYQLKKYSEDNYRCHSKGRFSFAELKPLFQGKDFEEFCIDTGDYCFYFKKTDNGYVNIPKDSRLNKIYVVGDGIAEDFILKEDDNSKEVIEVIEDRPKKKSDFVKLFENKMKQYKL